MTKIIEDWAEGFAVNRYGSDIVVDLLYPRNNPIKAVQIGLSDVRAADNVRLWYSFERDGWVVEQASTFEWDGDDEVCEPDWQEVAFVQAWERSRPRTKP